MKPTFRVVGVSLCGLALFAALAVWGALGNRVEETENVVVERRLAAMGTELSIAVIASTRTAGLAASERALRALEATEARLSTWRDDSELARLNGSPVGSPVAVSSRLAQELSAALDCARATEGAFDPTVGALVAAWNLRTTPRRPAQELLTSARAETGWSRISVERANVIRARPTRLEEGGFGKGAGLAEALRALAAGDTRGEIHEATLDFGGQIALYRGDEPKGTLRRFEIADPDHRDRAAIAVSIDRGSLSTSGNGVHPGHLLDPRTGEPAADFGSITVWAEDPLRADCLSTGLFVLGPERALAWAEAQPGVEVAILERTPSRPMGLRLRATRGWRGKIETLFEENRSEAVGRAGT
jgi:FAD:protein FMN transferase